MECNFENCGYYTDGECNICGMGISGEDTFCRLCKDNQNCYYKQLAELKAENERLKEENYQLQKDCQICENFIDFIPCKPIRDMDYDLQKVINQRDKYIQTLQEIKKIAETPKPFIDFSVTKTATEVEYDYAAICNELELRLHKVLELITKAEEK